jgi:hypothetical protein
MSHVMLRHQCINGPNPARVGFWMINTATDGFHIAFRCLLEVARQKTISKRFGSPPTFLKLTCSLWVSDSRPLGFRLGIMSLIFPKMVHICPHQRPGLTLIVVADGVSIGATSGTLPRMRHLMQARICPRLASCFQG